MMLRLAMLLLGTLVLVGCASTAARKGPPGVPVDSRPSPPPPPPEQEEPAAGQPKPAPTPPPATAPPPAPTTPSATVESVMTPDERRQALERIVADTTAAGSAVRRCASRKLLPDQESVFETTRSMLEQARAALARDEVWRAESLARKARQLATSLSCPG